MENREILLPSNFEYTTLMFHGNLIAVGFSYIKVNIGL